MVLTRKNRPNVFLGKECNYSDIFYPNTINKGTVGLRIKTEILYVIRSVLLEAPSFVKFRIKLFNRSQFL